MVSGAESQETLATRRRAWTSTHRRESRHLRTALLASSSSRIPQAPARHPGSAVAFRAPESVQDQVAHFLPDLLYRPVPRRLVPHEDRVEPPEEKHRRGAPLAPLSPVRRPPAD